MLTTITTTLGGIGLFLLGMILLTDGLKALAGEALRRLLARFTGSTLRAFLSGMVVTALVQSSSATTLTVIGFVSAGLLPFNQAVGVIFGANVGTTSTGWLVSLLGLKLNISVVALPLVGAGALMKLLSKGKGSLVGMTLAGFGMIFVGIDTLQAGMANLREAVAITPSPDVTLLARLLLTATGAAMTVVLQSSSAAVAATLAAVHSGALSFEQAAALVVGQNLGTTLTAGLAAIGASTPAKRTALAHVVFNLVTGAVAFTLLTALSRWTNQLFARLTPDDAAVGLAAFHTVFNLLGVMIFLPLSAPFARVIERLVREAPNPLTRHLDRSVTTLPSIAIESLRRTTMGIAGHVLRTLTLSLSANNRRSLEERFQEAELALGQSRAFASQLTAAPEAVAEQRRYLSTLHALDHVTRLLAAIRQWQQLGPPPQETAPLVDLLRNQAAALEEGLADKPLQLDTLADISHRIADRRRTTRPELLEAAVEGSASPERVLRDLEVIRHLDRLAFHVWRLGQHLFIVDPQAQEPEP